MRVDSQSALLHNIGIFQHGIYSVKEEKELNLIKAHFLF